MPADARVNIPFERHRLDNGLREVLSPDTSAPVVAVNLWYEVGSRNEREGRTGVAHLFEHMMIQGYAKPSERHRVDNGLRVVLSPDTSAPVVAVNLCYAVG